MECLRNSCVMVCGMDCIMVVYWVVECVCMCVEWLMVVDLFAEWIVFMFCGMVVEWLWNGLWSVC